MDKTQLPTRKELLDTARTTFKLSANEDPTPEQLKYVLSILVPSMYALSYHSVRGGKQPVTFVVPNYDEANARSHRPWQVDIINDTSKDKVVIKS